ncbi:RDD family protein [Christiangramia aquimixticola]|uniref:RDD family protein n=1 Tax=Christiangramia aquimixticola TaxID=1697558 RepID=UPI003AA9B404
MDNFQVETAQNISIQHNVAGVGERMLAFLIDLAIIVVYMIFAGIVMAGITAGNGSGMMYYLVLGLPAFLYYLLWESLWNGQTPGKAIMNIRVVKIDGTRPGLSNYLVRWLLRIIDISLSSGGVAVVTILFNGKGQRLGDIAAGTTVISEKKKYSIDSTLSMEVAPDYRPKYSQVTVLNDKDIQEIKNLYFKAKQEGHHHLILSLSEKVSSLLDVKFEERPMVFIERVLKDYNYYTGR